MRFSKGPALRWLDDKGMPNDVQPKIKGYAADKFQLQARRCLKARRNPGKTLCRRRKTASPRLFRWPPASPCTWSAATRRWRVRTWQPILPGSDPQLKNEYVVFTAHLDHLGIGDPVKGDSIYNGAADNASGTAALLEMARAFSGMNNPSSALASFSRRHRRGRGPAGFRLLRALSHGADGADRRRHQHGRSFLPLRLQRHRAAGRRSTPAWARWRMMWHGTWASP